VESIAASTEDLLSSVHEMAASVEQVTANTASLAGAATHRISAVAQTAA
jgi:methyl-accepting chemotaxis protein